MRQFPLDGTRLAAIAERHGVIPQVYSRLAVLPDVVRKLETLCLRYEENARRGLRFTSELLRILDHLESCGIEALPYKGPILSQLLYGDVTRRQFSDLDIFIRAQDVGKAKNALSDLGYRPDLELRPVEERAHIDSSCGYAFHGPQGRNLLDVQWRAWPRFYAVDLDLAKCFKRAQTVSLGNRRVSTLCNQDLFLVLCMHAAKHVWWRLCWLCDIAELIRSQRLDWDQIGDESRRLGIERIVALNLLLAEKLLAVKVPPEAAPWAKADGVAQSQASEIVPLIAHGEPCDTESISYFRLMMRLRERRQDRMRFLVRLAFTPSLGEWKAIRLPEQLFPLYQSVRLFRLARRLQRHLWCRHSCPPGEAQPGPISDNTAGSTFSRV